MQRADEIVNHLEGRFLGLRRKRASDIFLSEGFAELAVSGLNTTLPARLQFLRSRHCFAKEIEILIDEFRRERGGGCGNQMPAQIDFPVGQRSGGQLCVEALEK